MSPAAPAATAPVTDAERQRLREPPPGWPVMRQEWRHLGFLHWAVDPEVVAPTLPAGLDLDTFDGRAFVGVIPFTISGLPSFHEINVRTYVHRRGRDPGVWFYSLDAASRIAVAGARLVYKLPYYYAGIDMRVRAGGGPDPVVDYRVTRVGRAARAPRTSPTATFTATYAPTGPIAPARPGTLELFLTERYLLYAWDGRRLRAARVHHAPYPLQPASVSGLVQTLTNDAGLPLVDAEPIAHYASAVDVRIYAPHLVRPLAP